MSLGLLGAFAGGVLTLLSPCSAMLLPAFFSYAFTSPKELLGRTFIFYLGLVTTLVPLGILAGSVGAFVTVHREAVVAVAAIVVAIMGVLTALNVNLPFMPSGVQSAGRSSASVYLLGAVYGVAGVCAGPILGAVLTVAAASASAVGWPDPCVLRCGHGSASCTAVSPVDASARCPENGPPATGFFRPGDNHVDKPNRRSAHGGTCRAAVLHERHGQADWLPRCRNAGAH